MARTVSYNATDAASLKAPDITEAAKVFKDSLTGLGDVAQTVETGITSSAIDAFNSQIRQAQDLEALKRLNPNSLADSYASNSQISAVENTLRNRQANIFGVNQENALNDQLNENFKALTAAKEQIDPLYKDAVTLDTAGNPIINIPAELRGEARVDFHTKAENAFARSLQNQKNFVGIANPRERAKEARDFVRSIGGTKEQATAQANSIIDYQNSLLSLRPEEQKILEGEQQAVDAQQQTKQVEIDNNLTRTYEQLQVDAATASQMLNTQPSAVTAFIDTKIPNDGWFPNFWDTGGEELKLDELPKAYKQGIPPWLALEALELTFDPERGEVNEKAYAAKVKEIALSDRGKRLAAATEAKRQADLDKARLQQQTLVLKKGVIDNFKRGAGIRNVARTRELFNRVLSEAPSTVIASPLNKNGNTSSNQLSNTQIYQQLAGNGNGSRSNPGALQSTANFLKNAGGFTGYVLDRTINTLEDVVGDTDPNLQNLNLDDFGEIDTPLVDASDTGPAQVPFDFGFDVDAILAATQPTTPATQPTTPVVQQQTPQSTVAASDTLTQAINATRANQTGQSDNIDTALRNFTQVARPTTRPQTSSDPITDRLLAKVVEDGKKLSSSLTKSRKNFFSQTGLAKIGELMLQLPVPAGQDPIEVRRRYLEDVLPRDMWLALLEQERAAQNSTKRSDRVSPLVRFLRTGKTSTTAE